MKKVNYYNLRKAQLIDEAIEWQNSFDDYNYSYGELAYYWDYFYKNAQRYGLIKEFRENAII